MKHALTWLVLSITLLAVACAQGTTGGDDDDNSADAAQNNFPDARPMADAPKLPDARPIPDAAPIPDAIIPTGADSGLFCNGEADCPAADDCCFAPFGPPGFCVLGMVQLGVCLPN